MVGFSCFLCCCLLLSAVRYYGQSAPFGSNSFSGTNLAYLSIEEALADYAQVIKTLPTISPQLANAPVVAIGGSYGGVLSAWLRLKYPWAVVGAISASAPILYLNNGQLDTTFFEIATHDYTMNSPQCSANIRNGFTQFMSLYQEQDYATIAQKLRLCQQPTSPQEVQHILFWLINSFLTLAQFNYPYPTNFDAALPGYPVNFACNAALNVSGAVNPEYTADALELMGQAAGILNNGTWNNGQGTGTLTCFDPFAEFIQCADQTGKNTSSRHVQSCFILCLRMCSHHFCSSLITLRFFHVLLWCLFDSLFRIRFYAQAVV